MANFAGYKNYIYRKGTLLERQLFQHFFEEDNKSQVLKALRAYQNRDGGFGHGLEHDVKCPSSNSVATEAALFYLNALDDNKGTMIQDICYWVKHSMQYDGILLPPFDFYHYPYEEWWEDEQLLHLRVISIIGSLVLMNALSVTLYKDKIESFLSNIKTEINLSFYSYPFYLYEYATKGTNSSAVKHLIANISQMILENESHFPLFTRYWYWIIPELKRDIVFKEKKRLEKEIFNEFNFINPYPALNHWDVTFTLDAMVIYSKLR